MPNPTWRLTVRGRRDLQAVTRYTKREWGDAQAKRYTDVLTAAFERLSDFPELGRERPDLGFDVRVFAVERHLVVYRSVSNRVVIVRIVHQSMNLVGLELT